MSKQSDRVNGFLAISAVMMKRPANTQQYSYGNSFDNRRVSKQRGTPWFFNPQGEIVEYQVNTTYTIIYATNKANAIRKWINKYGT